MEKDEPRWTLAAIAAALDGDLENAMIAATPGGIEAQEARGQRDFVANETLPGQMNYGTREEIEMMGIQYIEQVDDLFWYVRLPDGWKKEPTDHSMWSKLIDDKGRERASIFYEAAFYDRDAFINATHRFSYAVEPVGGWGNQDREVFWHGVVKDCDKVVWETPEKLGDEPQFKLGDEEGKRRWLAWNDRKQELGEPARKWLDEHYPDWKDISAYWD